MSPDLESVIIRPSHKKKDRSHEKSTHFVQPDKETKRKRRSQHEGQLSPVKKARSTAPESTSHSSMTTAPTDLDSPFRVQTSSLYLPLSPISQLLPLEGLCAEHLSPLILTYYSPFRAMVLSYSNARLSEQPRHNGHRGQVLAKSVDEYAASFVWVTADFLLFQPRPGERIEGWVNLQNEGHLGLVCWNLFNASIARRRLPRSWTWVPPGGEMGKRSKTSSGRSEADSEDRGQGFYRDENGQRVRGWVRFRVEDIETSVDREKAFVSIQGSMVEDEGEAETSRDMGHRSGRSMAAGVEHPG